jgi:AAA domain
MSEQRTDDDLDQENDGWKSPGWKKAAHDYHANREGESAQHAREANGHAETVTSPLTTTPWWRDPETIPRRQFLFDRHYIRGTVSATIAAGGRAKTTRATYDALSMATGRELSGGQPLPAGALRVGMLNAEEDQDELDRRLAATCQLYGITEADAGGRLFAQSVRTLRLVVMVKGVPTINSEAVTWLLDFVRDNRLDVLIIDPLVSFHRVPENDNGAMDLLIKDVFGTIAEQTSAAVELCHHSGKAKEGRTETAVEDSRGASAIIWAVRSARVFNFMTPEEAAKLGIGEDQRRLHIRIANGKANMAPIGKAVWMKLVVEILANGDEIACATSWKPTNPFDGVSVADMLKCRNVAQGGAYRTSSQSRDWIGFVVAEVLGINISFDGENDVKDVARVKEILRQWFKNKVLATEKRQDAHRKERDFVVAGPWQPETPASEVYADDDTVVD